MLSLRIVVLVLIGSVCASHARRLKSSVERGVPILHAEKEKQFLGSVVTDHALFGGAFNSGEALATSLLGVNLTAAFHASALRPCSPPTSQLKQGFLPGRHSTSSVQAAWGAEEYELPITYPCYPGMFEGWEVGKKFKLEDNRDWGEWWRFNQLQSGWRRLLHPRSESGFGHCATHCEGEVLFAETSHHGNGVVRVLKHGPWRCLMCGSCEQGIAYFENDGRPAPQVLGYQYLRTMAAVALGFVGLQQEAGSAEPSRVLCIGLGTGALPGFLAHHLSSSLRVDVVEIDPVIVYACQQQLHCNFHLNGGPVELGESRNSQSENVTEVRPLYTVYLDDAGNYVRGLAESKNSRGKLSAIFLDAYDEEGNVPSHLLAPAFLRNCNEALAPGGVLVCNCFNGPEGSPARLGVTELAEILVKSIGPLFTLRVADGFPQNVVLVSRKGEELARPGREDLRTASLKAAGGRDLGIGVDRLIRELLWAETLPDSKQQKIIELAPPSSTQGDDEDRFAQWRRLAGSLPIRSSECRWGDIASAEEDEEEEEEEDEEESIKDEGIDIESITERINDIESMNSQQEDAEDIKEEDNEEGEDMESIIRRINEIELMSSQQEDEEEDEGIDIESITQRIENDQQEDEEDIKEEENEEGEDIESVIRRINEIERMSSQQEDEEDREEEDEIRPGLTRKDHH